MNIYPQSKYATKKKKKSYDLEIRMRLSAPSEGYDLRHLFDVTSLQE